MIQPFDLEIHQIKAKKVNSFMIFQCRECSFQAVYFENLNKFQVFFIGDPFVSHACQTDDTIREMIEELDIDMPEAEVEY